MFSLTYFVKWCDMKNHNNLCNTQQQQNETDWNYIFMFQRRSQLKIKFEFECKPLRAFGTISGIRKIDQMGWKENIWQTVLRYKTVWQICFKNAKMGFQKSYILPPNSINGSFSSQFLNSINQTTQPILSWFKQTPSPI